MDKKRALIISTAMIAVFIFSAVAISVSAAETSAIEAILAPFGARLPEIYDKYSAFVDMIIYLILFIGLAQFTIGKKFEGRKGGKSVVIGIGLIMAIGLAIWETQAGFNIKSFGPVSGLILLALVGYAIWIAMKEFEIPCLSKPEVAGLIYIFLYYSMQAMFPNIVDWFNKNVPIIGGLLALIAAVFTVVIFVRVILCILRGLKLGNWMGGGGGGGDGGDRPPGPMPNPTPKKRKDDDPPKMDFDEPFGVDPKKIKTKAPKLPKKPKIPPAAKIFVDLSPHFNGIRCQDGLGACTAFAATSIFEYILHTGFGKPKQYLSPLFLWYKSRKDEGKENLNKGVSTDQPMLNLQRDGVCFEHFWEFEQKATGKWKNPPDTTAESDAMGKKILKFYSLDRKDTDQWAHELLAKNPIYICIETPIDFGAGYRKKIYDNFENRTMSGKFHAIVIVGYHSHYPYKGKGIKAFKIRNSWNTDWGENGYTWIPADILKEIIHGLIVVKGWRKEEMGRITVTGRAVYDEGEHRIGVQKTGAEIYADKEIESPKHDFVVGLMGQIAGNLFPFVETIVSAKADGKFKIQLDADLALLEHLTLLPRAFPHFKGANFNILPKGLVVYKRNLEQSEGEFYNPKKEFYFHVTSLDYSKGGRGGEGVEHPENPCSALVNRMGVIPKQFQVSGIPLTFNPKHTQENNVIIPVVLYPWMKDHFVLDEKAKEALAKANEFARKEVEWTATEASKLQEVLDDLKEGKFELVSRALTDVGRCERVVQKFENALEEELEILIDEMHSDHAAECRKIKKELSALSTNILKHTSRYRGGLKRRFENLKGILDSLAKFKKPKFKKKISQIKVKAKIKKLHEEKALLLKELMPDTQQTITWLLGLEGELKRLIHLEAEIYAEAKQ